MEQSNEIKAAVDKIQKADLDQTIKDILIKDIQAEGLTPFLIEQINTYCLWKAHKTKWLAKAQMLYAKTHCR